MAKESRTSQQHSQAVRSIPKVSSGISGLDEILGGGIPAGRATLVTGGPGTGKSVLGLEFLYRSAREGRAGVFVTFEERADSIRRNAGALGWDLRALEKAGKLFLLEARIDQDAILAGSFNIKPLLAIIEGRAGKMNADRIVIDAIDVFMRVFKDRRQEREELYGLNDWLIDRGFTALVTAKSSESPDFPGVYEFLDYMADCVIALDQRVAGQIATRRVRVIKYRGSGFIANECPYVITDEGSVVMPVSVISLQSRLSDHRVSTGINQLDALSGGGYQRGATVLITGVTGTGKTTMTCTFVRETCAAGERVLYVSFEESQETLVVNMLSPGIDLRPALEAERLQFLALMPESMGVEQHLLEVLRRIERFEPKHVVVDAASTCHRMASERAAFDYLVRLIHACKERGITLILTNQLRSNDTLGDLSGVGLSSLIDTIVILRYMERNGDLTRGVRVYKSRGSKHSARQHPYSITDDGIEIETVPTTQETGAETTGAPDEDLTY